MQRFLFCFWTTVLAMGVIGQLGSCAALVVYHHPAESWGIPASILLPVLFWTVSVLATLLATFLFSFEKLPRRVILRLWAGVLVLVPGVCFLIVLVFNR